MPGSEVSQDNKGLGEGARAIPRYGSARGRDGLGGREIALMGLLVALGTLSSHLLGLPVGWARVFPVQHSINVLGGVLLGPGPAVLVALAVSVLRNVLGTGTLFAFPGSVFGALLAGLAYRATGRSGAAVIGEVIGTGALGSLGAFVMARWLLGQEAAALTFVPSFTASSAAGAIIAYIILRALPSSNR